MPTSVLPHSIALFFPNRNTGCPEADDKQEGSKEHCEPIDYFIQYFSWNIWKDIATCTGQVSKLPKPVTEKEVAQFVGIHIAMGTLKVSNNSQSAP